VKAPVEFDVPADPSTTAYPLFWETYAHVEKKPEFTEVYPDRPDGHCKVSVATLSLAQAMRRNRDKDQEGGDGG
jgi:hypothetical protein